MTLPNKQYTIQIGQAQTIHIYLVGCGGTGSFLADNISRLAHTLIAEGRQVRLTFIDHDLIEAKNIGRQKFCQPELGLAKAQALANRYSFAYGLHITTLVAKFHQGQLPSSFRLGTDLAIVISAVDTVKARKTIATAVAIYGDRPHNRLWWLDCGNNYHDGQLIIGNYTGETPGFGELDQCIGLPFPHIAEPGLLKAQAKQRLSCAERLQANLQSHAINNMMASWATVLLHDLILGKLNVWRVRVNLTSKQAFSDPIEKGDENGQA